MRVTIGLKTRDLAGQEAFNKAVQDKKSPLFHQYMTAAQWNAKFGPTASDEAKVLNWAKANGLKVSQRYSNRLLVDLDTTAAQLDAALHVTINNYTANGKSFYSNDKDPSLPSDISSVVSSVDGLNNAAELSTSFPSSGLAKTVPYSAGPVSSQGLSVHRDGSKAKLAEALAARAAKQGGVGASQTGGSYDPTDVYSSQMYDENPLHAIAPCCNPTGLAQAGPNTSIAIATVGNQAGSDIVGFGARYTYLAYDVNEINVDGSPACCDGEGTMDIEWSMALANSFGSYLDTAHIYAYDGVNAQITTFNDIFNKILTDNLAKVVSSSWGCAEVYCYTDASMNTNHAIFNSMIAQGFTLINASDDKGAYADCAHVSVQYPASDSNFLAISATNLELDGSGNYVSETAWPANSAGCAGNGGGGGGGCSVKFAAPSYQSVISGFCGSSAKAVPDLSLNGDWFNSPQNLYFNGGWQGNGGTSIAAPEFAGFMASENSYGLRMGNICGGGSSACAPYGQAGSSLYLAANSHAAQGKNPFYDVTSGCTSNNAGSGYCGIVGYDRATGWGTPNLTELAWALNYWNMPEASPPTVALTGPSTSGWVNSGTISWTLTDNGSPPSGVSGYTAKWDSDPGDPSSAATPGSGNSFYSGPASTGTSGSTSLAAGCHTLYVRAWDNIGESAVNSYGPVCYDNVAPQITKKTTIKLTNNTQVGADGSVPVTLNWQGADSGGSGLNHFNMWVAQDGGSYALIGSPTSPTMTTTLAAGHDYVFAVDAEDNAGTFGAFSYSTSFHVALFEQTRSQWTYSSGWTSATASDASGGSLKYSTTAGNTATFAINGFAFGFVSRVDTNLGNGTVSYDGGAAVNISTHGTSAIPREIKYVNNGKRGAHTLVITNVGTAAHPKFDVDAMVVIS